ncbi:MAG TPA: hypothetical protein VF026_17390 [Ktedonobacteraceae bacterium]
MSSRQATGRSSFPCGRLARIEWLLVPSVAWLRSAQKATEEAGGRPAPSSRT